jgi:hypothetical protein
VVQLLEKVTLRSSLITLVCIRKLRKSLVELVPSIEVALAYLIHMLETRFASLNPFMQYMFLKLHKIEDPEKKLLSWKLCA